MKKITLIAATIIFAISFSFAQSVPQSIKYQGVARDGSTTVVGSVGLRFTIKQGGVSGNTVYQERQFINTNNFGVFSLNIGDQNATVLSGDFAQIDWSTGDYFLQVELDPNGQTGGANFTDMGTSQILSVPFALYAEQAGSAINDMVDDADSNPTNEFQNLSFDGSTNQLSISDGNSITLPSGTIDTDDQQLSLNGLTLSLEDGGSVNLAAVQDGVDDADSNPSNEFQNLSFNPSTNALSISDGNSITLPSGTIDTDDQQLSLNGLTLSLEDGGSVNLAAVQDGVNDADSNPSNEFQNLSFNPSTNALSISDGNSITLPAGTVNTDNQQLSLSGLTLTLEDGGSVNLSAVQDGVNDADSNPSNEFQNLSFNPTTNTLSISDGNSITLPAGTVNTDNQQLSLSGLTLTLEDGGSVNLAAVQDGVNDADFNPTNEIQTLSKSGNTLTLSLGGGSVDVSDDDWMTSGNNIYRMNGNVGIGVQNPFTKLHVEDGQPQSELNGVINGTYTATTSNDGIGVKGYSRPVDFYGIGGEFEGGWQGVIGRVNPTGNSFYYGVAGYAQGGTGTNYAVYGFASGSGTNYAGFFDGDATVTGNLDVDDNLSVLNDIDAWSVFVNNDLNAADDLFVDDFSSFGGTSGSRTEISNLGILWYYGSLSQNAYLGYPVISGTDYFENGFINVADNASNSRAGMYVDASGLGQIYADIKNFKIDHPVEKDKEIWYACIEGPEAGAYDRGTTTLTNGEAEVIFSDHFKLIANPSTMTVILTPLSADSKGLAVVEKTEHGFKVKELMNGSGHYSFDWEVKCVRKGYEDYKVVRNKADGPLTPKRTLNNDEEIEKNRPAKKERPEPPKRAIQK